MEAKCRMGIEAPLKSGGRKRFNRGVVYDVSDLYEETIKKYFEEPLMAPPKGKQTRVIKKHDEEVE